MKKTASEHDHWKYLYVCHPDSQFLDKTLLCSASFGNWVELITQAANKRDENLILDKIISTAKEFTDWKTVYALKLNYSNTTKTIKEKALANMVNMAEKIWEWVEICSICGSETKEYDLAMAKIKNFPTATLTLDEWKTIYEKIDDQDVKNLIVEKIREIFSNE